MIKTDFTHNIPNVDRKSAIDFIFDLLDTVVRIVDVQDCFNFEEYYKVKYLIGEIKAIFRKEIL